MTNHINGVTLLHEKFPTDQYYPFTLPVFNQTERLLFDRPVTIFAGENGTGKSTLIEAMARACNIHIWRTAGGARYQPNGYEEMLHHCLWIEWSNGRVPGAFFGSEIFKDFKNVLDEWATSDPGQLKYFGGQSLVTQSTGQSMMAYFRSRYQIQGLYFLDEPETALSPRSQLELLKIIGENSRAGHAQFIMATHSPILMACEGAAIYSFDRIPIQTIAYEATDHYRIYRDFLADRRKYLDKDNSSDPSDI
ncbi:MAG: AAA family ATPase [Thermodesulfobacteriota bacterium]|nr:AAA family ATPase [Thermodesulfobacteriota bacterium]